MIKRAHPKMDELSYIHLVACTIFALQQSQELIIHLLLILIFTNSIYAL